MLIKPMSKWVGRNVIKISDKLPFLLEGRGEGNQNLRQNTLF
jgi:hypothetical protein